MAARGKPEGQKGSDDVERICLSPNTVTGELTCSICFEIFESPRTLPSCLHTFCEVCLFKVFIRASYDLEPVYLCPVCRKSVKRPPYGVNIRDWVKEFPVNHVINSLLASFKKKQGEKLQAPKGISSEQCSSCDALETTEFCFDCHDFMCQKCVDMHKHFKATKHHKTVSVSGMENLEKQVIELSKSTICPVHNDKKLEFYCKTDKKSLCSVCATVDHRKCRDIITLDALIRECRSTEKVKATVNKLNDIKPKLKSHEIMLLRNKETVKEDLRKVIKTVSDITNKAIVKLHELEKKTIENCTALKKQVTESINGTLQSCKTLEPNVEELVTKLDVATKFGSDLQIFLAMDRMKIEVDSVFQLIAEKHTNANNYRLTFSESRILSKLMLASTVGQAAKETEKTEIKPVTEEELQQTVKLNSSEPASLKSAPKGTGLASLSIVGIDHRALIQPATKNRKMNNDTTNSDRGYAFSLSSLGVSQSSAPSGSSVMLESLNLGATPRTPFSMDTSIAASTPGSGNTNKMSASVSSVTTSGSDCLSTNISTGAVDSTSGASATLTTLTSLPTTVFSFNSAAFRGMTTFGRNAFSVSAAGNGSVPVTNKPSAPVSNAATTVSKTFSTNISTDSASNVGNSDSTVVPSSNPGVVFNFSSFASTAPSRGLATIGTNTFSVASTTVFKAGNSLIDAINQSPVIKSAIPSRKASRETILEKLHKKKQISVKELPYPNQPNPANTGFDFSQSAVVFGQQGSTCTTPATKFQFNSSETVSFSNLVNSSTVSKQSLASSDIQTFSQTAAMKASHPSIMESSDGIYPSSLNTAAVVSAVSSLPCTPSVSTKLVISSISQPPVSTKLSVPSISHPPVSTKLSVPSISHPPVSTKLSVPSISHPPVSTKLSVPSISHPSVLHSRQKNEGCTPSAFVPFVPISELSSSKSEAKSALVEINKTTSTERIQCNGDPVSAANTNQTASTEINSSAPSQGSARTVLKATKKQSPSTTNNNAECFSPSSAIYNDAFPPLTSSKSEGSCSKIPISTAAWQPPLTFSGTDGMQLPKVSTPASEKTLSGVPTIMPLEWLPQSTFATAGQQSQHNSITESVLSSQTSTSFSESTIMYDSFEVNPTGSGVPNVCFSKFGGPLSLKPTLTPSVTSSIISKEYRASLAGSGVLTTTTTPRATLPHTQSSTPVSLDSAKAVRGSSLGRSLIQPTPIKATKGGDNVASASLPKFTCEVPSSFSFTGDQDTMLRTPEHHAPFTFGNMTPKNGSGEI